MIKRLAFVAIAAVLCLALIEFAADFARYLREKSQVAGRVKTPAFIRDDYVRYRFAPDQNTELQNLPVRINKAGLRGPELVDREFRVLCIGESVTFGWHASGDDATYPAYLGQLVDDLDAEVVNGGQPRCNSMNQLDIYITQLATLEPDVIVLMAGWNDIGYQFSSPVSFEEPPAQPSNVFSIAYLARLVLTGLKKPSDEEAMAAAESGPNPWRWEFLDAYERILRTFVTLARANGSRIVMVTLPHFLSEKPSDEEKKILLSHALSWPHISYAGWLEAATLVNERIRKVAKDMNVPLVEAEDSIEARYFTDLCHLDDDGNRLLAERIAPVLREQLQAK